METDSSKALRPVAIVGGIGVKSEFSMELLRRLESSYTVVGISRSHKVIDQFKKQGGWINVHFQCIDLCQEMEVKQVVERIESELGAIDCYIHLAGKIILKPFLETLQQEFADSLDANYFSALPITQAILRKMQLRRRGSIILTGATSSLRGGARSSAFSSGKFALRGLAQSLAREFGPMGIHVAHLVIDGIIEGERAQKDFKTPNERRMNPEAVTKTVLHLIHQDKFAWTNELDIRPFSEKF